MINFIAIDPSVLIAILNREMEAEHFLNVLDGFSCIVAAPNVLEVRIWLIRRLGTSSEPWFDGWVLEASNEIVAFDQRLERLAASAYDRFGKGRHRASLNFGDCMSYAVAVHHDVPLLFKGADFGKTDVRVHKASIVLD